MTDHAPKPASRLEEMPQMTRPPNRLDFFDCCSIMVGIVIGAGIYEASPTVAAVLPNAWTLFAVWIAGGVLSLAGALCYAELVTRRPGQGGELLYLSEAFGSRVGFLFAWGRTVIVQPGGIAAMSFTFARQLGWALGTSETVAPVYLASATILALTGVNFLGLKPERWTQNLLTSAKVLGLLLLVVAGILSSGAPEPAPDPAGDANVGLALILVLFCYGGWNEIGFVANEVDDPRRNITRSLVLSVTIVTFIYCLTTWSYLSALGYSGLASSMSAPTDTLRRALPLYAPEAVNLLVAVSALGAQHAMIFTGARLSSALGGEYPMLGALHGGDEVPPKAALVVQACIACVMVALLGSFMNTVAYTSTIVWFFFTLTGLAYFRLRSWGEAGEKVFVAPLHPWTGLLFVASSAFVAYRSFIYDVGGSLLAFVVLAAGLPLSRRGRQTDQAIDGSSKRPQS